jgi:hypothetical protein
VLGRLGSGEHGLAGEEARRRLDEVGPNVLRSQGARFRSVLVRQFRSFLLVLLLSAAVVSAAVGETTEAGIILTIGGLSVGLGFLNEFRSKKAVEALHSQIRRTALVERDGRAQQVDDVELVPGNLIRLRDIVPADLRLLESSVLECDESVLTGESAAAPKDGRARPRRLPARPAPHGRSWARSSHTTARGALSSCRPARGPRSVGSRSGWRASRAGRRPVRPRPQLAVHVPNVRAGDDHQLHPERTEFLDCTPQIGRIGGAIGNTAVPSQSNTTASKRRSSAGNLCSSSLKSRARTTTSSNPSAQNFLDCTPRIGPIDGAIGNRGAVPIEHERLEASVQRRESVSSC